MPRQGHRGVIMPTKIRKRGCSSSSSTSSRVHYKRPILIVKKRAGLVMGSRSSTPVPTWRTTPLRSVIDSPKYSESGKSTQPVSARRLAASLWEMNGIPPSPSLEVKKKSVGNKTVLKREKMQSEFGSLPVPPQLLDPSHCLSLKIDRSGESSYKRRTPSISQKLQSADKIGCFDSISNVSVMEIESRSRPQTSNGSVSGGRNRLKDVSNALTTSKELLKIISRVWAHVDQPSSSTSLISALHSELERARLQVNQFIQELRLEKKEINHLIKSYAEEKASWKNKEHQAVESAIASIANELEVERKLRRRAESLNKKLGNELAEMKLSFMKAVKELESEKRAREITEQVCDELARNMDEGDKPKRDSFKLSEGKTYEDKSSAIGKLRKQLDVFLGTKREKDEDRARYLLGKSNMSYHDEEEEDDGEVVEDSAESDLHSIELNMDSNNNKSKIQKWAAYNEVKARNSVPGLASRKSTSLVRSISNGVEWAVQGSRGDGSEHELEKEAQRRNYVDESERCKSLKDHVLSKSRLSYHNPSQQRDSSQMSSSKSRILDGRRSNW